MPLMMGNEAYSGFERSLAVCEIDETLIGMAKERFAEYLKKGVIKDSRFGDDSWDTYDEIRNCCLDFSFDKKAFAGNTQDWIGCTAKCYSDCLRTYVLMKFGELSLLRLQIYFQVQRLRLPLEHFLYHKPWHRLPENRLLHKGDLHRRYRQRP